MKFKNLSTGSVLTPGSELTVTQMLNHPEQYAPIEDAPAQNASEDAPAQNASEDAPAQNASEDAPAQNASEDAPAQNASEDASAQEKKAKDARK